MNELWTITELADRAAGALSVSRGEARAESQGTGRGPGRVRELPDPRTIRWYQTTGLVDRPTTLRGRTALYGRRQLAQVVAIKRLQAAGHPLAEIQARLAGATDTELASLADLESVESVENELADSPVRPRFWAAAARVESESAGPDGPAPPQSAEVESLHGVRLGTGVLLVLDGTTRTPTDADLEAVHAAAGPVLTTLRNRGLLEEET